MYLILTTRFISSTKDIFRLEAMANFLGVKILHIRSHLIEMKLRLCFVESSLLNNFVKQLSTLLSPLTDLTSALAN